MFVDLHVIHLKLCILVFNYLSVTCHVIYINENVYLILIKCAFYIVLLLHNCVRHSLILLKDFTVHKNLNFANNRNKIVHEK